MRSAGLAEERWSGMNKRKLCIKIIERMEWWRNAQWADHIDLKTKDAVITVMQNVVDGIGSRRQKWEKEKKTQ
jgi:hypothetical protein